MAQNAQEIKEKILSTLRTKGPSLPVHLAKATEQSILFASAFLSELLSENKIKTSHMRVGSSAIHFLQGQEPQLEKYSQHINGKEKEAYMRLKEKRFLKDKHQEPAIRVALREIKDFAIPFEKENEIIWRYFTIPESEFEPPEIKLIEKVPQPEKEQAKIVNPLNVKDDVSKTIGTKVKEPKPLNIFDEKKQSPKTKVIRKKIEKKPNSDKKNEKFFNKIKEHLAKNSIEILDIAGFSKNNLTLKVKINQEEKLLVAYNKKRISEEDIIKTHKKASELNLKYILLSLGEPLKKLSNLIEAVKNLESIEIYE